MPETRDEEIDYSLSWKELIKSSLETSATKDITMRKYKIEIKTLKKQTYKQIYFFKKL